MLQHASNIVHSIAPGLTVVERGWLNCNQILLTSPQENVLIDSGYGRHAKTTLAIVDELLVGASLNRLINTHCHSDHMGGNRAAREHYRCRVTIPVGEVKHVVPWTEQSCWSEEMDQYAEPFQFDDTIAAGDIFNVGAQVWQAIAAPGHDMDALMFWCESARVLMTGDALWERGMGFVWPSHVDNAANTNIRAAFQTFDAIEALTPALIIPGHGAPFRDVEKSLVHNRSKLAALAADPAKAARHVAKSLFVFALLDKQSMPASSLADYLAEVPVYRQLDDAFLQMGFDAMAAMLIEELTTAGAIALRNGALGATMRA